MRCFLAGNGLKTIHHFASEESGYLPVIYFNLATIYEPVLRWVSPTTDSRRKLNLFGWGEWGLKGWAWLVSAQAYAAAAAVAADASMQSHDLWLPALKPAV